jgi:hypothetical protein
MDIQDESAKQNNAELIRREGYFNPFFEVTICDLKRALVFEIRCN